MFTKPDFPFFTEMELDRSLRWGHVTKFWLIEDLVEEMYGGPSISPGSAFVESISGRKYLGEKILESSKK